MRFRLRTLMIVLAIGPPILAVTIYALAMLLGAGAPGGLFGPSLLEHYGGGATTVDYPYPELIEELKNGGDGSSSTDNRP